MTQTRRILVGIDLSEQDDVTLSDEHGDRALRAALAMASASGGTEVVAAYVEPGSRDQKHALAIDALLDRLRARVESAVKGFREQFEDAAVPNVRSEVVVGHPAKDLVHLSQQLGVGLIVVATHDRKGVVRALVGSIAEQVLQQATCPVLVLKPINHPKVEPLVEIQAPSHRPIHVHTHTYHHEGGGGRSVRPWGFSF